MPRPLAFLHNFRIHLPRHWGTHEQTVQWLAAAHAQSEATLRGGADDFDRGAFHRQMERHIQRFGPSPQAVSGRRSDIDEFLDYRFEAKKLFPLHQNPEGASMGQRMDAFAEMADHAVERLYSDSAEDAPEEMLHITCTGYASPSAAQKIMNQKQWHDITRITHVYHMGCYASLPAIRIAAGYLSASSKPGRCDLIHTEICTLHLNPTRHDPEQLVVQSLFADGYIRYSLSSQADVTALPLTDGFQVLGFLERIIPDSLDDIGWIPGDFGMRMTLSRLVPDKISAVLEPFLVSLASWCGLQRAELNHAVYAVHPGGPRILDKVEQWLNLEPSQLAASREILYERGNMSSATLPHVWERILSNTEVPPVTLIVSLAFGPGLTIYGILDAKGMNSHWAILLFSAQGLVLGVDEIVFHRARGLPRWERVGHPLDTLSVLLCLGVALLLPAQAPWKNIYFALALLSCLCVTKDEWVHQALCPPFEQWLHALLFLLHPVLLWTIYALWQSDQSHSEWVLWMETSLAVLFLLYQTLYWNLPWRKKSPR